MQRKTNRRQPSLQSPHFSIQISGVTDWPLFRFADVRGVLVTLQRRAVCDKLALLRQLRPTCSVTGVT
jgi:hypothetical protein